MAKLQLALLVISTMMMLSSCQDTRKPITVARTQLKVSRSLDPSTMQTVNVVTKDGSVAQLIVKRRDGKSQSSTTPSPSRDNEYIKSTLQTNWIPINTAKVETELYGTPSQIGNQITQQNFDSEIPKPVTIRSGNVFVKTQPEENKRGRSIIQLGSDGIPVIHGVREPDDEMDRVKVWRNARVINGELVPYENALKQTTTEGQLVYAPKPDVDEDKNERSYGPFTTADNFVFTNTAGPSIGPFTVDDVKQSSRGNYIRFTNDAGGIGPFTKVDNARFANSKLIDYIKKINEQESKRDYFTGRVYSGEQTDNHQIQRRMLQYGGNHNYPNSLLYTPTTTKLSRVNFNDGVRTPVLHYAHPELGVQPARVPSEEELRMKQEGDRTNLYTYSPDVNNDGRSPYTVDSSTNDDTHSGRNSDRQNHYYAEQGDYYRRQEMGYPPYGGNYLKVKAPQMQVPFWMRITESLKDNLQHGFARMQQFTRPVFDPIVEATHKIGHNLGLVPRPPYNMVDEAQEKVGLAAPVALGGSVILPALGLVAGGAALGLGAAAVGRFLDVGDMRSAQEAFVDQAAMQHKRSMQRYGNEDIVFVMETTGNKQRTIPHEKNSVRNRRSISYEDKYLDDLIQSVEHDSSATSLGSHLVGNGKWADTPCSKRMFCDIMIRQPFEQVAFMEKKIDSYLSMVHPVLVNSVSHHLQEVMSAVKRQDCSPFICHTPSM